MKATLFAALILSGCATSSGIVPMGPDTYMVSRQGGSGFSASVGLKADAMREAGEFCSKNGKQLQIVYTNDHPTGFATLPQAEVQFMCLNQGDPQLARPRMVPVPNQVVEIRQ